MDIVPVDSTILSNADQRLVVCPGHADEAAARVLPDGFSYGDTGGVEYAELADGGFGVELDDLVVIADNGNGAAEGGTSNLVLH